jgi:hypothetical protein
MRRACLAVLAAALASDATAQQTPGEGASLSAHLAQIGRGVQEYFARAQSIVCREAVRLQPLRHDLMPEGTGRRLVYELRVSWEPSADGHAPEATVLRQLLTVDGRPARPDDEPGCMDPKAVSPEPLSMLLPRRQGDFAFTLVGPGRTDGRATVMLDYRSVESASPEVTWQDDCVSVELSGLTRGRVWADAETGQVLRLDERVTRMFEFTVPRHLRRGNAPDSMTVERADSTIRYRRVRFVDPGETVMLPASIETLTIVRNAGTPRFRTTQVFSDYRRFMTGGRVVRE